MIDSLVENGDADFGLAIGGDVHSLKWEVIMFAKLGYLVNTINITNNAILACRQVLVQYRALEW